MRPVGLCRTRTAVSTLLTFCPPFPDARYVSNSRSEGSRRSSCTLISGRICTSANDVWRSCFAENGLKRTSRCTPDSPFSVAYAFVPATSIETLLMPFCSPSDSSSTVNFHPRFPAKRLYMRSSMDAQSWASTPPAPAWMVRSAVFGS